MIREVIHILKKDWFIITTVLLFVFTSCVEDNVTLQVETVTVQRRDIGKTVLATGIVKPKVGAEVKVGSRVSGIVKKLYVRIGDNVKQGQLLAELDPTEYQAKLNQADAYVASAKANLDYSRSDLLRQKALNEQNLISQNEYELAKRSMELAEAQYKQSLADLRYSQIQLEHTKIKSPISGIVASVFTQEGETVAASFSAPTFVTIIDLSMMEVWAYVDEIDIGRIRERQKAVFLVDTYSDVEFEGRVTAIFPKAEIQDNVVNYITTIEIDERKGKILRPEMTTTVNIFLETHSNALSLPNNVIRIERGKKFVYVLEQNNPVKRWVKTGISNEDYTEILEGVREGESILTANPEDFES